MRLRTSRLNWHIVLRYAILFKRGIIDLHIDQAVSPKQRPIFRHNAYSIGINGFHTVALMSYGYFRVVNSSY